jgi:TonB family protein
MPEPTHTNVVALLPETRPPWKEFLVGMTGQSLIWLAGIAVLALLPRPVSPAPEYHVVQLLETPYHPVTRIPEPKHSVQLVTQAEPKTPAPDPIKVPVVPKVQHIVEHAPTAPDIKLTQQVVALPPSKPLIPKQAIVVKTNVFSTGSSKPATITQPPTKVQTGGFGDPNGVPASNHDYGRPVTIAERGAFDLPSGPGQGNGTAGSQGKSGVVSSAGFGAGTAVVDRTGRPATAPVREGGFAGYESAANKPGLQRPAGEPDRVVPAEVLSKPIPAYTDEARKLHIEGEVLVEVVFEASGAIRVVRVVRGLGHGLDDRAVQAAQQIRFKPAMRNGQPADSRGVLHILFQIA